MTGHFQMNYKIIIVRQTDKKTIFYPAGIAAATFSLSFVEQGVPFY